MWMDMRSMFLTSLAIIAIPGYCDAGVITLQSPTVEHSDYNVEFNVADLVQNIETPHGAVEVHAFKSTENDEILREPDIPRYSQLIWVSLGSPTFVFQNGTESNSGHGLFRETVGGFYGYVQMLTSRHRELLAAKAKFRYNVSIDESQIVNLILSTFECSLYLHDQIGNEYQIKGSVNNFHRFPLKINFRVLPNSPERNVFALALEQPTVDHVFTCKMATKSRKTLTNTLKITSRMSEQIGLESKLFGPVEKRSDRVFITRQQSAMLARELYSALVIREEYDMQQNKFEEAFIQGLVSQAAAQSFRLQPIDTVLASISRYGTHDVTADLKPHVIKRDLGSILKVETRDEKSRIVLDETKISKEDDKFVVTGGISAGASFFSIFDSSASMNFGHENSHSKHRNDETLIDQLHELNTVSQNEVIWEIEGERVVPKSINVSQLIRSKFSQTLEFSRVSATHEEAAFVRRMGLSTLHGEKSAIQTTFCERMESQFQQLNETLQQLLNPKPESCVPLLIQQHVDESTTVFNRTWNDYKRGFNDTSGNYWIGNELLHQLTKNGRYKLRFDLQSHATQGWFWAEYNPFIVFDESTQYESLVDVYTGNAGYDAFRYSNKRKFSTYDRDNDLWADNCAEDNAAGFWYADCLLSCVNSMHGKHAGFYWRGLPGGHRLMTSRMWLLCR